MQNAKVRISVFRSPEVNIFALISNEINKNKNNLTRVTLNSQLLLENPVALGFWIELELESVGF